MASYGRLYCSHEKNCGADKGDFDSREVPLYDVEFGKLTCGLRHTVALGDRPLSGKLFSGTNHTIDPEPTIRRIALKAHNSAFADAGITPVE